jgi:NADH-quinone oxidoreductase subunit L
MLPWIVLFAPLVSAVVIVLFTRPAKALSSYISIAAVAVSFVCSVILFFGPDLTVQFIWLDFPRLQIPIGLTVDTLSKTMLLVVTGIGTLIHVYSLGYMRGEPGVSRYFAGLSIFMFSMLGIVLANNFVMMFIFWELVGMSSYVLIGHWYEKPSAAEAAKKAVFLNRIGDFGFMIGILMLWGATGTVMFTDLVPAVAKLKSDPTTELFLLATVLLIFCGPMGKSAQMPLHVWLPDAMEGPTPVSALIHAATMVAAGVYLLVRITFLVAASPKAQFVIAVVGMSTALFAALCATQQNDIKRILAYSTLSQLGYMIGAVGFGASEAGMFHLFTHAQFKALLFLGAGSVITAMHHEQDIWKMGGLMKRVPITFVTFVIGALALSGCPFLSGSYSKDEILAAGANYNTVLFLMGWVAAILTAFYMTRLVMVVFINRPLSEKVSHAGESPLVMIVPLMILAFNAVVAGYPFVAHFFNLNLHPVHENATVEVLAPSAFLLGVLNAWWIYRNRTRDPIHIGLFAHKFYFDELYLFLVRVTQDALAKLSNLIDRYFIDGLLVKGSSALTFGAGFVLRFFQVGNAQAYAIFFGLGVLALVYFILR